MRIALHTYEATRSRKSGLENHAVQLIKTLQKKYSLEGIVQTNRRIALYDYQLKKIHFYSFFRWLIEHIKIASPAYKSFSPTLFQDLNNLFYEIDVLQTNHQYPIHDFYKNFKKLHINSCIYDTIKFHYRMQGRKAIIEVPKLKDVDVFWLTTPFPMYMKNTLNVCTIHDLFCNSHEPITQASQNRKMGQILDKYDLILAVSDYTRRELIRVYPHVDVNKIHVCYQALPEKIKFLPDLNCQLSFLRQLNLHSKRYLLHVGSLIPRKNQKNLIKAFLKSETELPLIMVGKKGKYLDKELMKLIKTNFPRVIWLNHIPDKQLNILYHHASAFLFPSFYEGFGIPILEAFYHQCPIMASSTSALPEVAGEAALYVDPHSIEEMSNTISKIVSDTVLQRQLIHTGLLQLAKFSDENILEQINSALCSLK